MIHTFLIELTDEPKNYEKDVSHLELIYGAEEFDLKAHDKELIDKYEQLLKVNFMREIGSHTIGHILDKTYNQMIRRVK